jgi:ubiquinone/menaquinone biosynthesis C-methylase UbiE
MIKKKIDWDYSSLAKYYDYRADYNTNLLLNLFKKREKNLKILEIGAGTGKLTKILLQHFKHVYAIEPNKNMMSIGKKNLKKFNKKITWKNISAENIDFKEDFFDLIIFGSSFNVIKTNKIFSKIKKNLKSKGEVFIVWNNRSFKNKFQFDIENIIKTNIPKFNYGLRRSNPKKILIQSKIFSKIYSYKKKFNNKFIKKDFISGWKSHGTLYKQAKKKLFNIIIDKIKRYVNSTDNSKFIVVPYFTNVWICKKK